MITRVALNLIVVAMLGTGATARAHVVETTYESLADAKLKGAVSDGLVPAWVPAAATMLQEARNAHNRDFLLRMTLPAGVKPSLPSTCKRVSESTLQLPFKRAWWPKELPGGDQANPRYLVFACDDVYAGHLANSPTALYIWRKE